MSFPPNQREVSEADCVFLSIAAPLYASPPLYGSLGIQLL